LKNTSSTSYETDSEDESILYRDSVYTPPSGFTSDTSIRKDHSPQINSPPEILRKLLQSGQLESESEDLNSTLSSCYPEAEAGNIMRYSTCQNLVGSPYRMGSSQSFGSTIDNDNQSVNSELEEIETSDIPVEHEQLYEKNVVKNVENISKNNSNSEEKYDDDDGRPGSGYSDRSGSSNDSVIESPRKELLRTQSTNQTDGEDGDISNNFEPEESSSPRQGVSYYIYVTCYVDSLYMYIYNVRVLIHECSLLF
jgi:hypothetical protein